MINLKLSYIDYVERAERLGFKILKIDEFLISRAVWPLRAWTTKGNLNILHMKDHHQKDILNCSYQQKFSWTCCNKWKKHKWSSIYTIYWWVVKKIVEKYGERRKVFILTWDGTRYHSTSTVKDRINDIGITWVQTVPYTPEFSPIKMFNNRVKSIIRKSIIKRK